MKKISTRLEPQDDTTIASYIISSLKYLSRHSPNQDVRPILQISASLCTSTVFLKLETDGGRCKNTRQVNSKNLISSLEYLKHEASRHKLEDIEMILDAAFKLCLIDHYYRLRVGSSAQLDA